MTVFSELTGRKLHSFTRRECDWLIVFDGNVSIQLECLWRLLYEGKIAVTSEDHGHLFGHTAPVDAAKTVYEVIGNQLIKDVTVNAETLDVNLKMSNGGVLQIIPNSSGYEAWSLSSPSGSVLAIGGGELFYST